MKTFARVAALALIASSAFSGASFAQSMISPSASLASAPQHPGSNGPQVPIPTCSPDDNRCNFFPSGK